MEYTFYKYHGCGNDYIYFDAFLQPLPPVSKIPDLCRYHTGIGGDGIVFILPSDIADGKMVMYNMDGSRGKLCGNALRCVAKHLVDQGHAMDFSMEIETDIGVIPVTILDHDLGVTTVRCCLQGADFAPSAIPIRSDTPMINYPFSGPKGTLDITCLSMGNPHCVLFEKERPLSFPVVTQFLSKNPLFLEGVNVEIAHQTGPYSFFFRVLERGTGETLSCGSGACAIAAAAVKIGLCPMRVPITVTSTGGTLTITVSDHCLLLEGPAVLVFSGTIEL